MLVEIFTVLYVLEEFFDNKLILKPEKTVRGFEDRICLSEKGIDILATHWGTTPSQMRKFLPWPMKQSDTDPKKVYYSQNWLNKLGEHQSLCRTFSMAIVLRGRSISSSDLIYEAKSKTMIGAKITYQKEDSFFL